VKTDWPLFGVTMKLNLLPRSKKDDPGFVKLGTADRELRNKILRRDNNVCQYCGARAKDVDHIIPRCHGGTHNPKNLIAACKTCNVIAGGNLFRNFEEKKAYILERRKLRLQKNPEKIEGDVFEVCQDCGEKYLLGAGTSTLYCAKCNPGQIKKRENGWYSWVYGGKKNPMVSRKR
jgi:HNH endonuclease